MSRRLVEVQEVTESIRAHGVALCYDERTGVELWTPHRKMPIALRRAVRQHSDSLRALMLAGDSSVCPSPRLHRRSWRKAGPDRKVCLLCLQIDGCRLSDKEAS